MFFFWTNEADIIIHIIYLLLFILIYRYQSVMVTGIWIVSLKFRKAPKSKLTASIFDITRLSFMNLRSVIIYLEFIYAWMPIYLTNFYLNTCLSFNTPIVMSTAYRSAIFSGASVHMCSNNWCVMRRFWNNCAKGAVIIKCWTVDQVAQHRKGDRYYKYHELYRMRKYRMHLILW